MDKSIDEIITDSQKPIDALKASILRLDRLGKKAERLLAISRISRRLNGGEHLFLDIGEDK